MARYGKQGRNPERIPDWILGGPGRRAVFEELSSEDGCNAAVLAKEINAGPAWIYEILRVLRSIDALESARRGQYRFSETSPLARAIAELLLALDPYQDVPVERPPSRRAKDQ